MSEYIEIETEETDDPDVLFLETNIQLVIGEVEYYDSAEAMEVGSPLAQALAVIPGIESLEMDESTLIITRDEDTEWYAIIEDASAAIKDFFL